MAWHASAPLYVHGLRKRREKRTSCEKVRCEVWRLKDYMLHGSDDWPCMGDLNDYWIPGEQCTRDSEELEYAGQPRGAPFFLPRHYLSTCSTRQA
jgi:hypothetical protein